jgi:hypothetical protein
MASAGDDASPRVAPTHLAQVPKFVDAAVGAMKAEMVTKTEMADLRTEVSTISTQLNALTAQIASLIAQGKQAAAPAPDGQRAQEQGATSTTVPATAEMA